MTMSMTDVGHRLGINDILDIFNQFVGSAIIKIFTIQENYLSNFWLTFGVSQFYTSLTNFVSIF